MRRTGFCHFSLLAASCRAGGEVAPIRPFHILLAHLLPGSVSVSAGQRVGFSTIIGQVGNSGRSYVPHLHMQAQRQDFPGAPTIEFCLANYLELDSETAMPKRWYAASVPREGDAIAAAASSFATRACSARLHSTTGGHALGAVSAPPAGGQEDRCGCAGDGRQRPASGGRWHFCAPRFPAVRRRALRVRLIHGG